MYKPLIDMNSIMKNAKKLYGFLKAILGFVPLVVCFLAHLIASNYAYAEDLELINRPVNTSGLTGLLFTTAPFTLPPGTIETAASILSENSVTPDYTITEYPVSVTVGMSHNSELSLRTSYFAITEGPTGTSVITRKSGDLELAYKWDFMPQQEASVRPAVAVIVAGITPMDNKTDMKMNSIVRWGFRLGIATGSEISWKDHTLGIYADGQIAGQDLTEKRLMDLYRIFNAGLIFPISKYQNLQMFIEYSLVSGKEKLSLSGGNYNALTYGLRLASERFNLTVGTQFLRKKVEGYDKSGSIVGLLSMKF